MFRACGVVSVLVFTLVLSTGAHAQKKISQEDYSKVMKEIGTRVQTLRKNVDFPPWFAPVMTTSSRSSALTSLPTTLRSPTRAKLASYSPRHENRRAPGGPGTGKHVRWPFPTSSSCRLAQPM